MVTIAELLVWRPNVIDSLAEHLYDKRSTLVRLQDEINDARPPESWEGLGTVSAWKTYDAKRIRLNDLAAQISDLAVTLKETGEEVKGAQHDLQAVLDQASGEGHTVNHQTGEVEPPKVEPLKADERDFLEPDLEAQKDYERAIVENANRAQEFEERIDKAIKRAEMADVGLAKSMSDVAVDKTRGGSGGIEEAVASQLPPSLDGMTPEEIAETLGGEIAIETVMAYLEGNIPIYKFLTADFQGSAAYQIMQNGQVKMSLHMEAGIGLRMQGKETLDGGIGSGGFTDFEITFDSKEEAERFLAGLDDAAKDVNWVAGRPMPTGLAEYISNEDVTSKRVGLYGKGDISFGTPYADGGASGRAEGWYDEEKKEYGLKVDASFGGHAAIPEAGVKAGASVDVSGEVKTDEQGVPKSITLSGAVTGEMANKNFGLDVPGVGSGGGGDVQLTMDSGNVMWGEMQEALKDGDMSRAAEIAKDHGQVVIRATTVTTGDQELGVAETGSKSTSSAQAWVRPPNSKDFVAVSPQVRP